MNRRILLIIVTVLTCICCTTVSYSQWQSGLWIEKQANNWFYGTNEGLNFSTSPPTPVAGQIQFGGNVGSGAGAMSDPQGNLLFYSDGITVWNKNHEIMENGTGLFGDPYRMQTGLIVPIPGQVGHYYVFSLDSATNGTHGLSYSEVDLSLDSGLGAVTQNKNLPLAGTVAGKISATYSSDGNSIWVLCHLLDGNQFAAYKVDASGISTTPVLSAVGESYSVALEDEFGQLKFSPDGTKVGYSNPYFTRKLQVFNFDKQTGILSNPILTMDIEFSAGIILGPYGLEFSPNSELLYVTEGDDYIGFGSSRLHQFNLRAGDEAAVKNSDVILKEYNWTGDGDYNAFMLMGAMQLTPEGKIYVRPFYNGSGAYVNAINYPNNIGLAAQYEQAVAGLPQGVQQDSAMSGWYPGFVQSYFASGILYSAVSCDNEADFSLLRIPGITAVHWDFGDSASEGANESNEFAPTHIFSGSGTYTVTAEITSNGGVQTTTTRVTIGPQVTIGEPQPLKQCAADPVQTFDLTTQETLILNGQTTADLTISYHTSQEDAAAGADPITTPETFVSAGQAIYVRLTNTTSGCYKTAAFDLILLPLPVLPENKIIEGCGSFDLTAYQGAAGPNLIISYFTDEADAQADTNKIINPEKFPFEDKEKVLYARGTTPEGCFEVTPFTIAQAECFIQKGISPNNDGKNDFFDLDFIAQQYGVSSLEIFNRYGKSVYQKDNYSNQWTGLDANGNELPTGTYYYVIQFGQAHPEFGRSTSSWIYIQRQE